MSAPDRGASLALLTGVGARGAAPAAVGQKFTPEGAVLPFAGNTFLCHIPPGPAHEALCHAAARLRAGPLAPAFAFLPPESYHMTVFEGVTDRARSGGRWPEGLEPSLPVEAATAHFLSRLEGLSLPQGFRIRPTGVLGGHSLRVTGATEEETARLRETRRLLREATGIRRPDFESYGFHITLAYPLRWLLPDEAGRVADLAEAVSADLAEALPEIALGPIEFCRFDDMHAFPLITRLPI